MRHRGVFLFAAVLLLAASSAIGAAKAGDAEGPFIASPGRATARETLAAREIQRYVYVRTGQLLPIVEVSSRLPGSGDAIVVARKDRSIVGVLMQGRDQEKNIAALGEQCYALKTIRQNGRKIVLALGGDDVGTLYAAYRLAEHLGVRFYLHGDVIPDVQAALQLPDLDEQAKPLFSLRGIQPFHDFPEGPDWWNLDEYKAILSQLPKLRMNFFGLHTYPEGHPNAEPTVWIGLRRDVGRRGQVNFSYPSSYQNTLRGNWGYTAKKTSDFVCGASALFERDDFGPEAMFGMFPQPEEPDACNAVFNRVGAMLGEAFGYAHALGIKTCVGTETPLTVPRRVQERLKKMGKDPANPTVIEELYEGIFARIARTYPLDYYWFWTPETWTWQGIEDALVEKTIADMKGAIAAAEKVKAPFTLATCGWVLGPQGDRAMFDAILPKQMPMSCINRQVGKEPVDQAFAKLTGRPKWAIPWLEDDPALTSVQLWAGRMRRDAADALRYGCTGLMGIHWRTRVLGPNVLALARAAWDQEGWNTGVPRVSGPRDGQVAAFPNNPIADTEDDPLYQTVRWDVSAYQWEVPNGKYIVKLQFCEPHYSEARKRVFGVRIEGKPVIGGLDIFAKVGQNRALDYTFDDVVVADGRLDIEFTRKVEFPCIAAIAIEGKEFTKKINCGGPAYKDYEADPPPPPRDLPARDFFDDWALHEFGPEVARETAEIFDRLDGETPRSSDWVGGPGGLNPDPRPWEQVGKEYAFIDQLEALRPRVKGAGNLERFDYWLGNFRYMRAASRLRCLWAQYNAAIEKVKAEKDPKVKAQMARQTALPLRKEMAGLVAEVYSHLLPTVSNAGEMGTVANWDQHILPTVLTKPGEEMAKVLGEDLPADAMPPREYAGPPRLIVPTARATVAEKEVLRLKVIYLGAKPPRELALFWRPLGVGEFARAPLQHAARGVYFVEFPEGGAKGAALEYYVRATADDGMLLHFPATAPQLNQTVVLMPLGQ